jgi:hypothetical protein
MILPLQFPDQLEEARLRAEEFQRLSSDERWRQLAGMFAFGWETVRTSPHCTDIEQRMDEQEQEWRQIQRELFARHG